MQMREKVGKSRNTVFFQWFVAPEGRRVGSLKRRVRSHLARWEMKNCTPLWCEAHFEVCTKHTSSGPLLEVAMSKKWTPLWREAHFEVKMYKAHQHRTTFRSCDGEKVHAVVVRSTFPSQNVKSTTCSDHFWKLRCRKSERRCGAKHISKSKCTKHTSIGPLLEVAMAKKCKPLWREAHFEVKMYKTHHVRSTFGGSDLVSRGRRRGLCTLSQVSKTWRLCSIFNYNHHCATLHSNTLHYNYHYNYTFTTFHYATLHYTPLHYTTFNYTQVHSITLHYTTLQYNTLHCTTLHHTTIHFTTVHCFPLHSTTLHSTPLHSTTLHSTTLTTTTTTTATTTTILHVHYGTLDYTTPITLHYARLHYTTLHYTEWHCTTDRQVDR